MKIFKNIFLSSSAVFASLPGVAIMISNLFVPPGQSKILFGGLVEIFGNLTLIILWVNRNKILHFSRKKINKLSLYCAISGFICIIIYLSLTNIYVKKNDDQSALFPIWISSDSLSHEIAKYKEGGLIAEYGASDVRNFISDEEPFALAVTIILFLLFYVSFFNLIVLGFGLTGIKSLPQNDGT